MNTDVLASYTQNIAESQKNDSRINAVYSGCLVVRVGGSRLGVGLIKCCDFQRSLLARLISDPCVLATRGAYVFIFSFYVVCCLYVTFLLPPERATKAGPCHLLLFLFEILCSIIAKCIKIHNITDLDAIFAAHIPFCKHINIFFSFYKIRFLPLLN